MLGRFIRACSAFKVIISLFLLLFTGMKVGHFHGKRKTSDFASHRIKVSPAKVVE
jgi:hypothetical protein